MQHRTVINYCGFNGITISPEYLLLTIQILLSMLDVHKVWAVLDMQQGFHRIEVEPRDH